MRDHIFKARNEGGITLAIITGYSKGFDKVDHKNLIVKLYRLIF